MSDEKEDFTVYVQKRVPTPEAVSINQVRQILFNELGLTREYVRTLVRDIVTDTCDKYFRTGEFEKWLRGQIDHELKTWHYGSNELKATIASIVGETVRREITDKLTVTATLEIK